LVRGAVAHGRELTLEDVKAQQADTTLTDAQFFTPYIVKALKGGADPRIVEAIGRLRRWDRTTPTGTPDGYDASDVDGARKQPTQREIDNSVAAAIYAVWRGQFIKNVVDATLGRYGLPQPGGADALNALKNLLVNYDQRHGVGVSGVDFFQAVPGGRDGLILKSLADALDLLAGPAFEAAFHGSTDQADYRWGALHRMTFGEQRYATDGGFSTVDVANHPVRADSADEFTFSNGPARRFVAQPGRPGQSSLPGGSSETPGSPYFANLLPRWLTNGTYRYAVG
jgi:penicillin G amidase